MWRYIGRLFLAVAMSLGPLAAPVVARAAEPTVIISEIGWAGSSRSTIDEWLELTNLTDVALDLSGWSVAGAATSGGTITIPEGSAIGPFQTFLISNYASDDAKSALERAPNLVTASVSLSNSTLALVLRDANGNKRDAAGDGTAPAAGRTGGGDVGAGTAAMVRSAPVGDGTLAGSWADAVSSAGFDDEAADLGTPGETEAWFEETGDVEETTSIGTMEDTEEPKEQPEEPTEAADQADYTEPESSSTETVETNEKPAGEIASSPSAPRNDDEPSDAVATENDEKQTDTIPDVIASPEGEAISAAPTTNYPVGTLLINELVSDADEEWIEIYNPYNNVIPLGGWSVRDASGKATALPDQLIGWDQYIVVRNPTGKLNNDVDAVDLIDPNGATIDAMNYGADDVPAAEDGDALARDADGAWEVTTTPTPGAANAIAKPIVIEKPKPAPKPAAKKTASTRTETPAKPVAEEPASEEPWSGPVTLRLSELYPNTTGGDLVEEFVEIENTGDMIVDLKGWSLADASDRSHRFDLSLKIKPGELLTLTRAETRLALNNTADSVTLIAPDGTAVDSQSYASPTKGSALVRADAEWVWTRTPTPDEPNVVSQDEGPRSENARPAAAKAASSAVAAAPARGRSVTTRAEGVVLVSPGILGKQIFYVETETGGIQVYKYDGDFPDLSPGDRVVVTGTRTESRGEPRLKVGGGNAIDVLSSEDEPAADDTTISALSDADHGRLVHVTGSILSRSGSKAVLEDRGAKLSVRIADGTDIDATTLAKGADLEVTGILVSTESGLTLLPRSPDDIAETSRPEQEQTEAATTTAGKDARNDADRTMSLAITAAVVAGLGLYSLRRILPAAKRWYAKTRALRAAPKAAH